MADQEKIGRPWGDDELDAIVADYFDMLVAQRSGEPFVKSHRAAALMEAIGRTHRWVEFKHMNVSAVLRELGLPPVRGYKPKLNVQQAILPAIERYLLANPGILHAEAFPVTGLAEPQALFVEPPPVPEFAVSRQRQRLERLIRKFDPTERDFRNRALGKAGEGLIVDFERRRLVNSERADLARKIRWVSQEDGDGAGYDILSFHPGGRERLIEVKTTRGPKRTPFWLTSNERSLADDRPDDFHIVRLYEFGDETKLFKLRRPLQAALILEPASYRASFE